MMGRVTTILIVDDHAPFRASARALLMADGLVVIGEAIDGSSAIDAARTLQPDLVLVDIGLPDLDGFEVARRLAGVVPAPLVILTSSREAVDFGPRAIGGRVVGFLAKDQLSGPAIRALVPGP